MRIPWHLLAVVVCALAPMLVSAAVAAEPQGNGAPAAVETEYWNGSIELPGMSLDVSVALTGTVGTMSIPMQGVKEMPLRDVVREGEMLRFTFAPPGLGDKAWAHFEMRIAADGASAEGNMTQSGQAFPARLTRVSADQAGQSTLKRPQTPKPPFPYEARDVQFSNGPISIAGTLTVPAGNGPHPAVVLMSGSGGQDRDETIFEHRPFLVWADALTRAGVAVLRVDDRGVGGTTGNLMLATEEEIASDGAAGVKFLRAQPGIDPARIGVMGHSEGGALAPHVAASLPEVTFVVMLAGYALKGHELLTTQSIEILRSEGVNDEAALERVRSAHTAAIRAVMEGAPPDEGIRLMGELVRAQTAAMGQEVTDAELAAQAGQHYSALLSPWFRSFLAFDPSVSLARVEVPVLAVFGERDVQVPPAHTEGGVRAALERAGNKDVTIMVRPGLNHLLQPCEKGTMAEYASIEVTVDPATIDLVVGWIRGKSGLN